MLCFLSICLFYPQTLEKELMLFYVIHSISFTSFTLIGNFCLVWHFKLTLIPSSGSNSLDFLLNTADFNHTIRRELGKGDIYFLLN